MKAQAFSLAISLALVSGTSLGQREGERPPRPDSASNAAIGGWCDALTGEKKQECLRDERRREKEKASQGRSTSGSCDALIGPERERCLREGGSLEVKALPGGASSGGSGTDQ